jgi:hypothetical protein
MSPSPLADLNPALKPLHEFLKRRMTDDPSLTKSSLHDMACALFPEVHRLYFDEALLIDNLLFGAPRVARRWAHVFHLDGEENGALVRLDADAAPIGTAENVGVFTFELKLFVVPERVD